MPNLSRAHGRLEREHDDYLNAVAALMPPPPPPPPRPRPPPHTGPQYRLALNMSCNATQDQFAHRRRLRDQATIEAIDAKVLSAASGLGLYSHSDWAAEVYQFPHQNVRHEWHSGSGVGPYWDSDDPTDHEMIHFHKTNQGIQLSYIFRTHEIHNRPTFERRVRERIEALLNTAGHDLHIPGVVTNVAFFDED